MVDCIGSVIMHFRCKLGRSKTPLKQITNIKELYTSQIVFFDLMLFRVTCVKVGNIDYVTLIRLFYIFKVLPVLFKYCCKYCYNDSRKL